MATAGSTSSSRGSTGRSSVSSSNRRDAGEFDGPIPIDLLYNDVWILDVDGVRLVIDAHSDEAPTETVRSEVRQIVESIRIER